MSIFPALPQENQQASAKAQQGQRRGFGDVGNDNIRIFFFAFPIGFAPFFIENFRPRIAANTRLTAADARLIGSDGNAIAAGLFAVGKNIFHFLTFFHWTISTQGPISIHRMSTHKDYLPQAFAAYADWHRVLYAVPAAEAAEKLATFKYRFFICLPWF